MIPEKPEKWGSPSARAAKDSSAPTDKEGLILPRKLMNPCLVSHDRQSLHRELLFNQKVGKNVLNQKSELQKAMQKHREKQNLVTEKERQNVEQTPEFCRTVAERARKHTDSGAQAHQEGINSEYLKARAKLRATVDSK